MTRDEALREAMNRMNQVLIRLQLARPAPTLCYCTRCGSAFPVKRLIKTRTVRYCGFCRRKADYAAAQARRKLKLV